MRGFAPSIPHGVSIPVPIVTPISDPHLEVSFKIPNHLHYDGGNPDPFNFTAPSVSIDGETGALTIPAYTSAAVDWSGQQIAIGGLDLPHFDVYLVWKENDRKFDIEFEQS